MRKILLSLIALLAFTGAALAQAIPQIGPGPVPPQALLGLNNTWSGTNNFTGTLQIGGTAVGALATLVPGAGCATWLTTPSSANLATCLTDETGTGASVFANTPTLVTPNIGAATGTSLVTSGNLQAGSNTAAATTEVIIDTAAGQSRNLDFQTNGLRRWVWQVTNTAEGGSNAGSNLALVRYADTGNTVIDSPITVNRAVGIPTFINGISFNGATPTFTGTGTPTCASTGTGCSNQSGDVTAGASATSVVITFSGGGYGTGNPSCNVTAHTQLVAFSYTVSNTAITITQTATSGDTITYFCVPH